MSDTPAFRAELALVQRQLVDLSSRHECRAVLVIVHPDGSINRVANMTEEHVKRVCGYVAQSDTSTLQPLPELGAG